MITNPYVFCKSFTIVCKKLFNVTHNLILNIVISISANNYNLYLVQLKTEIQAILTAHTHR